MNIVVHLTRGIRSELAKLSWRNPLWYSAVPLAILIPFALNFGIAKAAEMNAINGEGGMDTDNAAYWIIVFSTFILMTAVVSSLCGEFKDGTIETVFAIEPRRWILPGAKLLVFGAISALVVAAVTFGIMGGFPYLFPDIWGRVDLFSGPGLRLWLGIPVLTVLVCALGIGLSALIPRPGLVIMIVLLWKFGLETFVGFLQGDIGTTLTRYAPFKNAELGVGQVTTVESPFGGPTGSLLYFAALCIAVYLIGVIRLSRIDIQGD